MRDTDGNADFNREIILDYRYYNTEINPISKALFAFIFFGYSDENNKQGGEIDLNATSFISKKITIEKALGAGLGKNFKLFKGAHLEIFAGPKIIRREVLAYYSDLNSTSTHLSRYEQTKLGLRGGVNLAFQF